VTQHSGLTLERWRQFSEVQRLLMIGNEMQRARSRLAAAERESLQRCYERVLRLTDLTASATEREGMRKELLRWRDLIAELFLATAADQEAHERAFRQLLLLSPESARQIPLLGLAS
jgi:hypothetical protein